MKGRWIILTWLVIFAFGIVVYSLVGYGVYRFGKRSSVAVETKGPVLKTLETPVWIGSKVSLQINMDVSPEFEQALIKLIEQHFQKQQEIYQESLKSDPDITFDNQPLPEKR